jgi:hypothetical protein
VIRKQSQIRADGTGSPKSALQAEGPGFESPSLHQIRTRYSETEAASFLLVGEVLGEVAIILPGLALPA